MVAAHGKLATGELGDGMNGPSGLCRACARVDAFARRGKDEHTPAATLSLLRLDITRTDHEAVFAIIGLGVEREAGDRTSFFVIF